MINAKYKYILLNKFDGMSAEMFKNLDFKTKGHRYSSDIKNLH